MRSISIIPARGGSTRIPRKNIKEFHGKPIIAFSIGTAIESRLFDRIIVSTDDQEIAHIAQEYGAIIHKRSEEMSRNEIGTQEVIANVLRDLEINKGLVCCIYPTAPLMLINDLKRGLDEINYNSEVNYAFSVGTNPLCDAGQFYWGWAFTFLSNTPLISEETSMIPIAPERICDINTPEDFLRAEKMYAKLH